MLKIDPAFLFELASAMRRVQQVNKDMPAGTGFWILDSARLQIHQAISESIYAHALRVPVRTAASTLLAHIERMLEDVNLTDDDWGSAPFNFIDVHTLQRLYNKFETLFVAELQATALYLVLPKGGYSIDLMIEGGEALFSRELAQKAPAAESDLKQATRCIAFELPTAAGFHLHRAHESVLRIYWDCVTGGAKRPKQNSMGVYLRELDKLGKGRAQVRSHLQSIKDLHRNPLMHPDQSLESVDEALDLLSAIRCSIGYMLKEIPGPETPLLDHIDIALTDPDIDA